MANKILAGAVVNAGMVIAGVDADNPPVTNSMPTTWTQAAGTSQDWDLEVVSGQSFSLTIDTGTGASTGVNLFDENDNYVYGWSQDWTLNVGWTPSSSGTYRIRFNSNPHFADTTFTVTSTSGLA